MQTFVIQTDSFPVLPRSCFTRRCFRKELTKCDPSINASREIDIFTKLDWFTRDYVDQLDGF